ncbi:MAG: cytochrome c oxidase subunit II [Acidobacteriota bacterium]
MAWLSVRFWLGNGGIFSPKGTPAHAIFGLSLFVLGIAAAIFVTTASLLAYALIRFRERAGDADHEPAQIYGSSQIELAWTVVPLLIVVILFLTTARVIFNVEYAAKPESAVDVVVIGHQFWWEFRYPKLGIVTANELHIPVSDPGHPTPTYLEMSSADTDHSFWVPELAGKTDLIPNRINTMWIDAEKPGLYLGQCAQFCGVQHAKMLLRVYGQSKADFDAWVELQQQPANRNSTETEGQKVFLGTACVNCHAIAGTSAAGRLGPNLTHLASRDTIASGSFKNSPENLRKWVQDPNLMKPGCLMPAMHLSDRDLTAVVAYLGTLH